MVQISMFDREPRHHGLSKTTGGQGQSHPAGPRSAGAGWVVFVMLDILLTTEKHNFETRQFGSQMTNNYII